MFTQNWLYVAFVHFEFTYKLTSNLALLWPPHIPYMQKNIQICTRTHREKDKEMENEKDIRAYISRHCFISVTISGCVVTFIQFSHMDSIHTKFIYIISLWYFFFTGTCTFGTLRGSMIYKSVYVLHLFVCLFFVYTYMDTICISICKCH